MLIYETRAFLKKIYICLSDQIKSISPSLTIKTQKINPLVKGTSFSGDV